MLARTEAGIEVEVVRKLFVGQEAQFEDEDGNRYVMRDEGHTLTSTEESLPVEEVSRRRAKAASIVRSRRRRR